MEIDRRSALGALIAGVASEPAQASPPPRLEQLFPIPCDALGAEWSLAQLMRLRILCAEGRALADMGAQLGINGIAIFIKIKSLRWDVSWRACGGSPFGSS